MLTSSLVTRILEECGTGWTRARALEILNHVQNELLANNNQLMRIKPDPFFVTAESVYSYNAYAALGSLYDIRTVQDIYSLYAYGTVNALSPLLNPSTRNYIREKTRDGYTVHAIFDCEESRRPYTDDAGGSYDCGVSWWSENDPGTTTATWRAKAYRWPNQLLSENIQLEVPSDFQETVLLWGVLKRTERREFGRNDFTDTMFEKEMQRFEAKYLYSKTAGSFSHVHPELC